MTTKKWKKFPSRAGKSPTKTNCPNDEKKKMSKICPDFKESFFLVRGINQQKRLECNIKIQAQKVLEKGILWAETILWINLKTRILEETIWGNFFWRRKIAQNIYMMHVTYEKTSIIYSPPSLLSFIKLIVNFFETTYFWFSSFANIHASKPQSQNRIPSPAISKAKKEKNSNRNEKSLWNCEVARKASCSAT